MGNVTIHDIAAAHGRAALRTDEVEVQSSGGGASAGVTVASILAQIEESEVVAALGYTPARVYSVKDPTYGAWGDDTHDDTSAVEDAAVAAMAAGFDQSPSGPTETLHMYSRPTLFFPPGIYKITSSALTSIAALNVVGDNAIIHLSDGVTGFSVGAAACMTKFRGLGFRGGAIAIASAFGTIGGWMLDVGNCVFNGQSQAALYSDDGCANGQWGVHHSLYFSSPAGGRFAQVVTCDKFVLRDSLVGSFLEDPAFEIGDDTHGASVEIYNCGGGPAGSANLVPWVWLRGGSLTMRRFRCGGESGHPILHCDAAGDLNAGNFSAITVPSFVDIQGCDTWGNGYGFKFTSLPNVIRIKNNTGVSGGFLWDPSIPVSHLREIGHRVTIDCDDLNPMTWGGIQGGLVKTEGSAQAHERVLGQELKQSTMLRPSDVARQWTLGEYLAVGWGTNGASTDVSGITTDLGRAGLTVTATADGAWRELSHSGAMAGLATGPYTLVIDIEAVDNPFELNLTVSDLMRQIPLRRGVRTISLPFYHIKGTSADALVVATYDLQNGTNYKTAQVRILKGTVDIDAPCLSLYGAAPTRGQWYLGDSVIIAPPVAGGSRGTVCTTAGYAGVTAWAPTTAVTLGLQRSNGGLMYECVGAGTTAGSGGPSTTGINEADGTAHWMYIGAATAAVFKTFGAIAS